MGNPKTPIALLAVVCFLLAGCGIHTSTQSFLSTITITPAPSSMAKGVTQQLTATGTWSDGTTKDLTNSVNWSSTSAANLTVSASGLAKALSPGQATIRAIYGSGPINQILSVTVTNAAVSSIAITGSSNSIGAGSTLKLTATATETDGTTSDLTTTASWKSSDPTLATISAGGLVTAKKAGAVTITATDSATKVIGSYQLTVTAPVLTAIVVKGKYSTIFAGGGSEQLAATGTFTDGSTGDVTSAVNWSSTDATVASVNAGLVTGGNVGAATMTAGLGGVSASFQVTVADQSALIVNPSPQKMLVGSTLQIVAQLFTGDVTATATWTSSDPGILAVVSGGPWSGLATARQAGSATLTVTSGSKQAVLNVAVTAPTSRFAISANTADSTLSVYTVNNTNGSLMPFSYLALSKAAPKNVVVDPTGQFAYVAVQGGISALTFDSASGTLKESGFYPTTLAPAGMSIDPAGANLYAADGNQIFAFAINPLTGALGAVNGSPFANVDVSNFVAVEPLGHYLYSSVSGTNKIAAFALNADGSLQALSQPTFDAGLTPQAIAFDASGMYLFVANSGDGSIGSYSIDPGTGILTPANSAPVGTQPIALSVSPAGQVYFLDATGNKVGSAAVDLTSGDLTANTNSQPTMVSGASLSSDLAHKFLYTLETATTSQAETYWLDVNGNPQWASVVGARANGAAIAFVPGSQTVYGADFLYSLVGGSGNYQFSIDPASGTLSNPQSVDGGR